MPRIKALKRAVRLGRKRLRGAASRATTQARARAYRAVRVGKHRARTAYARVAGSPVVANVNRRVRKGVFEVKDAGQYALAAGRRGAVRLRSEALAVPGRVKKIKVSDRTIGAGLITVGAGGAGYTYAKQKQRRSR